MSPPHEWSKHRPGQGHEYGSAHVKAAAPRGPRFDSEQTPEDRSSIENGIWLCQECAKLIDSDAQRFPADFRHQWKVTAEQNARRSIEQPKNFQAIMSFLKA